MSEGIDFSWARPGGAAIKAAGKTFVMRYLYPDGQGGKGLDASEVADYRSHGLLIGTVFESSGGRMLGGYAAGVADAHTAAGQLAALGMAGTVVYFADDFDATVAQYGVLGQYLDGAASVLGKNRTGLYAGFGPIDALCGGAHAAYGWQTYAWSGNHVSSKANVYQYKNGQTLNGGSVDLCRNLKADFGAFGGTALAGDTSSLITGTTPTIGRKDMQYAVVDGTLKVASGEFSWIEFGPGDVAEAAEASNLYGWGANTITMTADQWRIEKIQISKRIAALKVALGTTSTTSGVSAADIAAAVKVGSDAVIAKIPTKLAL